MTNVKEAPPPGFYPIFLGAVSAVAMVHITRRFNKGQTELAAASASGIAVCFGIAHLPSSSPTSHLRMGTHLIPLFSKVPLSGEQATEGNHSLDCYFPITIDLGQGAPLNYWVIGNKIHKLVNEAPSTQKSWISPTYIQEKAMRFISSPSAKESLLCYEGNEFVMPQFTVS